MKKTFLIAFVVFLMPALSSALDFELSLKEQIDSLNVEASLSSKGENVAGALAIEFGTKEDIIQKQKIDSGLSWGDLSVALYISNRTGKDINIIVKDYKKGHGWGRIAIWSYFREMLKDLLPIDITCGKLSPSISL